MRAVLLHLLILLGLPALAQHNFKAVIKDASTQEPLAGVTVLARLPEQVHTQSDNKGVVLLKNLPPASLTLQFSFVGYNSQSLTVVLPDTSAHTILLQPDETALHDVVVVASTRSNDRIENATMKVEVLGLEDMNEESMIKPGNIASLLGDISGVQIQQSSATSGNANVRIQGLDGRYTQILRDGMPLYDGFSGGFGVLSIPPLDLKQLELIKGAASTLYGGGAIAGLINFISKKPSYTPDASLILNQSSLGETNANMWYAQRGKRIGFTLFAGQTFQKQADVDKDGLSDVPRINSTFIHPTVFIYPSSKSYISLGWSGSFEKRNGGDMQAIQGKEDAAHPYFEKNQLQRNTFTLIGENRFSSAITGIVKSSLSLFNRHLYTNTYLFKAQQQNMYVEASLIAKINAHTFIGGINTTADRFRPAAATPVPVGSFFNTTVGAFAQETWQLTEKTKLEGGLRADHHQYYGTFILPRIAAVHRFNEAWAVRAGFGMGYKTPNALAPQIKDYDMYDIQPIGPTVKAEKSIGNTIEVNYKKVFDKNKSIFINHAFFLTQINYPIIATEDTAGKVTFSNQLKPVLTKGFDTYIKVQLQRCEAYLGYTYTVAERKYLPVNQFMPLTPQHRVATTLVYEIENRLRAGLEASYTGQQHRDDDSNTPGYFFIAAMVEWKLNKKISVVLNAENLLDERQSKYEQLFTGTIRAPVYKPLWAPIDGRVINCALRIQPFAK